MSKPVQIQTQVYRRSKRQSLPPVYTSSSVSGEAQARHLNKRSSLPQVMVYGRPGGEGKLHNHPDHTVEWCALPPYDNNMEQNHDYSSHYPDMYDVTGHMSQRPEEAFWLAMTAGEVMGSTDYQAQVTPQDNTSHNNIICKAANLHGNVGSHSEASSSRCHTPGQSPVGSGMDSDPGLDQGSNRTRSRRHRRRSKQMEGNMEQFANVRRSIPSELDLLPMSRMSLDDPVVQNALRVMNLGSTDHAGVTSPLLIQDLFHPSPLGSPHVAMVQGAADGKPQLPGEPVLLGRSRHRSRARRRSKQSEGSLERYAVRRGSANVTKTEATECSTNTGTPPKGPNRRLSEPAVRRRLNSVSDENFRKLKENLVKDWSTLDVDKLKDLSIEQLQELLLQQQVLLQHHRHQFQENQHKQEPVYPKSRRSNSRTRRRRNRSEKTASIERDVTRRESSPSVFLGSPSVCSKCDPNTDSPAQAVGADTPDSAIKPGTPGKDSSGQQLGSSTVPTGTPPTVSVPSSTPPSISVPSSTPPSMSVPSSTPPSISVPSSTPPSISVPSSTPPSISVPSSTPPSMSVPSSTPPSMSVPSSTPPTSTPPTSTPPSMSVPSSTPPTMSAPSSTPATVSVPSSTPPTVSVPSNGAVVPRNGPSIAAEAPTNSDCSSRKSVERILRPRTRRRRSKQHDHSLDRYSTRGPVQSPHHGMDPFSHNADDKRNSVPALVDLNKTGTLPPVHHRSSVPAIIVSDPIQQQKLLWQLQEQKHMPPQQLPWVQLAKPSGAPNQPEQRVLHSRTRRRRSRQYEGVGDLSASQADAELASLNLDQTNTKPSAVPFNNSEFTQDVYLQETQPFEASRQLQTREFYNHSIDPSTIIGFHRPKTDTTVNRIVGKQDPYGQCRENISNHDTLIQNSCSLQNLSRCDMLAGQSVKTGGTVDNYPDEKQDYCFDPPQVGVKTPSVMLGWSDSGEALGTDDQHPAWGALQVPQVPNPDSVGQTSPNVQDCPRSPAINSVLKATSEPFIPRQNLVSGVRHYRQDTRNHGSNPVLSAAASIPSLDMIHGQGGYAYIDNPLASQNFMRKAYPMTYGQRPRSAVYVDPRTEAFLDPWHRRLSLQHLDGALDQFSDRGHCSRRGSQPFVQEQYGQQTWRDYQQQCPNASVSGHQLICHLPSQQQALYKSLGNLQSDPSKLQSVSNGLPRSKSVEWDASTLQHPQHSSKTQTFSRSLSENFDALEKINKPKIYRSTVFIDSLGLQHEAGNNDNQNKCKLKVYTSQDDQTRERGPQAAASAVQVCEAEGKDQSSVENNAQFDIMPNSHQDSNCDKVEKVCQSMKKDSEQQNLPVSAEHGECVYNNNFEGAAKRPTSINLQQRSNASTPLSSQINSPEDALTPGEADRSCSKTMVDASTETGHVRRRRTRVRRRRRRSMQYVDENLDLELDQCDLANMENSECLAVNRDGGCGEPDLLEQCNSSYNSATNTPSRLYNAELPTTSWAELVGEHTGTLEQTFSSSKENLLSGIDAQYEELKQNYVGKEPKKKNRKQKLKELNQKGEGKEGTDMDAFTVSLPDVEAPVTASEIQDVEVVQDNKEQEENMIEAPISSSNTTQAASTMANGDAQEPNMEKVMITVEDDKVAEKNEKNVEDKRTEDIEKDFDPIMIEESNPVIKKDKKELKYKYREDQWSPLNPEGKKHYDRGFLLQLQFAPESQEKPDGLPKLPDVILDKPHMRNETSQSGPPRFSMGGMKSSASMPDFTPGFIKASPGGKGPGMGGGRNRSQQKKGGPEPRKVITIMHHEVKLHTTDNAWKPGGRKSDKPVEPVNVKTEELYKKVRSILNKLAPQRFQTLIQQIMDLEIDSEERLKGTIDLVFEKAIDEPNFSVAYANMCKCMMPLKVPTEKGEMVTFRALLLNRCQKEFEKDKVNEIDLERRQKEIDAAPEDKKKELKEAKDLAESKAKRRSLGNIRFIGELFKLRMLTEGIMHDCLFKLLRSNDEDSLECLCRLLTTIGKDIDHEKAKPRINQYFMQMDKIVNQKRTTSRVRFMLLDVKDLRSNNWVPRREDNNPKTIDQINKEAQHEAIQKAAMIQNVQVPSKRGSRGDRGPRGGPGGGPPASDDGWQAVTKTSRNILDPSRMKLTKQNVDENIQLGPGGRPGSFGSWGRGSSGGGKTSSQEADRPSTPANRFSALSERPDTYSSGGRMGGRGLTPSRDSSKGRSSGLGPQRGKNVARLSAEQDRDSALAAVRNIVSGGGGRSPMGSRNQSRDNSRNRDNPREREFRQQQQQQQQQQPPCKEHSEDEIEKKTKAIMDEFLHLQDYKEAIQCVKELESPKTIYFFVYTALNHVLERSPQARKMTGTLLHDLIKQKVINVDIYLRGVKEVLEYADDMEIDIPMIWKYLGELMGPMVQDGSVPLGFLSAACEPLLRSNKAGILVAEILQEAVHRLGHIKVAEQWKASGLLWSNFLAPNEDVTDFLRKRKLEYTVDPQEPRSPDAQTMPISKIETHLHRLLIDKRAANEVVFDWIEANVGEVRSKEPAFIRALMTAACSSAITGTGTNSMKVDPRQIQERLLLLQRYLDHQAELELQALFALQALVHKLEHPPGVLQTFFDTLYDEDIISEDAFNQWETSTDAAEQAGKGVARTSVTQFFTWLREAEEEGQEEN